MASAKPDILIAGGGLAGGLAALALKARHPAMDIAIVEGGDTLGGNHVWSFFASDIPAELRHLTAPLVVHGWKDHEVRFPAHARVLAGRYYSVESERLDAVVRATLPPHRILTGRRIAALSPESATLADGERIAAGAVLDARGAGDLSALDCGWQKFVGQLIELDEPHAFPRPIIMDATVAQHDGYRFVYTLPFAADRLFVEDTYYSDTPDLDRAALRARIRDHVRAAGLTPRLVNHHPREEAGVLPVPMGGDRDAYWRAGGGGLAKIGAAGGFFHAVTSYSLPSAVRVAGALAERRDFSPFALHAALDTMSRRHWAGQRFYRMLNTMLFRAAAPTERYRILERFYRLPEPLIQRFYAGDTGWTDMARILAGKPPVPVSRAIGALARRGQ